MLPFAETEPFWKPPNVFDCFGVFGIVLAVFSIWYAWYLAQKDLAGRIAAAEAGLTRRFRRGSIRERLRQCILDIKRTDREAASKNWKLARAFLDEADESLAAIWVSIPTDDRGSVEKIRNGLDFVRQYFRSQKERAGAWTGQSAEVIRTACQLLAGMEMRYSDIIEEGSR
jgi:hypothetical protein